MVKLKVHQMSQKHHEHHVLKLMARAKLNIMCKLQISDWTASHLTPLNSHISMGHVRTVNVGHTNVIMWNE
jgi:hypothetical protein